MRATGSSARRRDNPFFIPSNVELFGRREEEKFRKEEERRAIRDVSLVQRTDRMTSALSGCVGHAAQKSSRSESTMSRYGYEEADPDQPRDTKRNQSQRTAEFIQQKREVFHVQLLIDRKSKEIKKMSDYMAQQEHAFDNLESDFEKGKLSYKLASAKVDSDFSRARKAAEMANRRRVEKQKKLKLKTNSNQVLKSMILRNMESVEFGNTCREFLRLLVPEGENPGTYFETPEALIEKLTAIEDDNRLVIDYRQHFGDLFDKNVAKIEGEIAKTDAIIERDRKVMEGVAEIQEHEKLSTEVQDIAIEELRGLVKLAYVKCFRKESDSPLIIQLEKIESGLEDMYKQIDLVDPQFAMDKQCLRDRERRERQRHDRHEQQTREQKLKIEHAIERANRPIKKKTGRPIYARNIPVKIKRKDDAEKLKLRREQQRIDDMLFGELE